MKRFAETKHDAVALIPGVVRIGPIAIQPELAGVIALDIPDVRIAIGII